MNNATNIEQSRPNKDDSVRKRDSWLYAMPFVLILLAISINIQKPAAQIVHGSMDQGGDTYRQLVFGGIYLIAFILTIRKAGSVSSVVSGHWAYIAILGYILSSALWSTFPMQVVVAWVHFTGFFFICVTAVIAFNINEEFFFRSLVYFSSIAIIASLLAVVFYPSRGIVEGGRWTGFAFHPNYLGIVSLISVWANTSYLYYKKDFKRRAWSIFLILLSFLCLYGSNSMTSTILSVGIVIGIPFMIPMAKKPGIYTVIKLVLILFVFTVFVFTAYILFPEILTADSFFHAIGRRSDLTGRTELWEIAKSAIAEKPLIGWSFDNNASLSSKHMTQYGQFHNGYLDLLVRGGFLGLMFAIYITVKSFYYLFKLHRVKPTLFVLLLTFLVAILVHNISEASIVRSTHPMWLMLSVLYFMLNRNLIRTPKTGHA